MRKKIQITKHRGDPNKFLEGILYAVQQLVIFHGEDAYAKYIAWESGFTGEQFLAAQKNSGYENRRMNKFFRDVFKVR